MANTSRNPKSKWGSSQSNDRAPSRLAFALSISMALHILVAILVRPTYKPVADHAVNFTVADVTPGPPKKVPPKSPDPKTQPQTASPPKPKAPGPSENPKPGKKKKSIQPPSESPSKHSPDAGPEDGGPSKSASNDGMAATGTPSGTGTGICMPNLFPFSRPDATWMLWVSLSSFRETSLESSVGTTLQRFAVGDQMQKITGLDPKSDVEGVLVAAEDVFASDSFRIVLGYDSGEDRVKENLTKNLASGTPLTWTPQPGGSTGTKGETFIHLAGSGRVMVAGQDKKNTKEKLVFDPRWPRVVECISSKIAQPAEQSGARGKERHLENLAKPFIAPDPTGRWPVALLATTDPRTIGLRRGRIKDARFEHALIRAFFSEPIRIEGQITFRGKEQTIKSIADQWTRTAKGASKDPFFIMAGLAKLFDGLVVRTEANQIHFSITLTESQARAGMLFLQLQSDALERQLNPP